MGVCPFKLLLLSSCLSSSGCKLLRGWDGRMREEGNKVGVKRGEGVVNVVVSSEGMGVSLR